MDQHKFRTDIGSAFDIASLAHDMFWTVWGFPYIYWVNKYNDHGRMKRVHLGEFSFLGCMQELFLVHFNWEYKIARFRNTF
jgi:hypothetical protein